MRVIFDNNIWISFLIGKRLVSLQHVFTSSDVDILYCDELEREFLEIAHRPKIQKYVNEQQVHRVHRLMTQCCHRIKIADPASMKVRDPKDVYLLALADAANADYLVSGDSDLTDIHQYNRTAIIDVATFLALAL